MRVTVCFILFSLVTPCLSLVYSLFSLTLSDATIPIPILLCKAILYAAACCSTAVQNDASSFAMASCNFLCLPHATFLLEDI